MCIFGYAEKDGEHPRSIRELFLQALEMVYKKYHEAVMRKLGKMKRIEMEGYLRERAGFRLVDGKLLDMIRLKASVS